MEGYAEESDVSAVLQDDFAGANPSTSEVEAAIVGQTEWLTRRSRHHFYDSNATSSDLTPTTPRSATDIRLDVPSSPHRQDRQIARPETAVRYPVTQSGDYTRVRLPHPGVEELSALRVRDYGGDVTDWVADSDYVAGRGEDYYVQTAGDEFGRSHLYLRATSIGARTDYTDLLTVDYTYGFDEQSRSWQSVRRAVALRAAAELVIDDEFEAAVPNETGLVNVQTKADQYRDTADTLLEPYLNQPIA